MKVACIVRFLCFHVFILTCFHTKGIPIFILGVSQQSNICKMTSGFLGVTKLCMQENAMLKTFLNPSLPLTKYITNLGLSGQHP